MRIEEIGAIGKTLLTWLTSKNAMPCPIASEKRVGQDAGGTVLNGKSFEVALNEIDSQITDIISPQEVSYKVGNPPWEKPKKPYVDNHGLTRLIEKLNNRY